MILESEQAGSIPSRTLSYVSRRRPRHFVIVIAVVCALSLVWLWTSAEVGGFVVNRFPERPSLDLNESNVAGKTTKHPTTTTNPTTSTTPLASAEPELQYGIPPKLWQILLPYRPAEAKATVNPEQLQDTPSWLAMNRDYAYTLVGHQGGREFVEKHFASRPEILEAFDNIPNVGMKSDLLRYLILSVEGGVYTDTDTVALRPVDEWIPEEFRDKVRLIVGIEFDRRDGGPWADISHWVQFCQWTIAAAPGHPVFTSMTDRILEKIKELSETYSVPVSQVKPTSFEVMNSTGPAAWTDVVFEQLQLHDKTLNTTQDLSFMTEPKLYGDILVLTIDGFGMGQGHSNSTNDGTIPQAALVKHLFRGSWRDN